MADNASDQERSLPASPRRLEQAREEGQVARSRELSTAILMLAGAGGALLAGAQASGWMGGLVRRGLTLDRTTAFEMPAAMARAGNLALDCLVVAVPFLLILAALALAAPLLMGGWVFTPQPMAPDLERLSPGRWLKQVFSIQGLTELGKAIAKAALVSAAALILAWQLRDEMAQLLAVPSLDAIGRACWIAGLGFLAAACAMVLVAAIDVPAQLWQYHKGLRMTPDEARREMKETEGDPHLKQRIRSQQRDMARRRMMADVPKASVVVTNPTHYAVALAWDDGKMGAPRVVAKGADLVAARIKELAAEHGVPTLESPPLARALHKHVDVGREIPAALYTAVAQVLAWTYALKAGHAMEPGEIEIPAGLDPQATAS